MKNKNNHRQQRKRHRSGFGRLCWQMPQLSSSRTQSGRLPTQEKHEQKQQKQVQTLQPLWKNGTRRGELLEQSGELQQMPKMVQTFMCRRQRAKQRSSRRWGHRSRR